MNSITEHKIFTPFTIGRVSLWHSNPEVIFDYVAGVLNRFGLALRDPHRSSESLFMKNKQQINKERVLEAFDTLFNKRDYAPAEKFWSPQYIQHSAHIGPGREGLFDLIRSAPVTLKWEHGLILAEDDYVMVHSRYSGNPRPSAWVVIDIVRMESGILAEHWDVIQDEATEADSKSGKPMFGNSFPPPTAK